MATCSCAFLPTPAQNFLDCGCHLEHEGKHRTNAGQLEQDKAGVAVADKVAGVEGAAAGAIAATATAATDAVESVGEKLPDSAAPAVDKVKDEIKSAEETATEKVEELTSKADEKAADAAEETPAQEAEPSATAVPEEGEKTEQELPVVGDAIEAVVEPDAAPATAEGEGDTAAVAAVVEELATDTAEGAPESA